MDKFVDRHLNAWMEIRLIGWVFLTGTGFVSNCRLLHIFCHRRSNPYSAWYVSPYPIFQSIGRPRCYDHSQGFSKPRLTCISSGAPDSYHITYCYAGFHYRFSLVLIQFHFGLVFPQQPHELQPLIPFLRIVTINQNFSFRNKVETQLSNGCSPLNNSNGVTPVTLWRVVWYAHRRVHNAPFTSILPFNTNWMVSLIRIRLARSTCPFPWAWCIDDLQWLILQPSKIRPFLITRIVIHCHLQYVVRNLPLQRLSSGSLNHY